jgi:hypothetical protein
MVPLLGHPLMGSGKRPKIGRGFDQARSYRRGTGIATPIPGEGTGRHDREASLGEAGSNEPKAGILTLFSTYFDGSL